VQDRRVTSLTLPRNLAEAVQADKDGQRLDWVAGLPHVVAGLADRWSLLVDEPFEPGGQTAWVAPARTTAGDDVVLKVLWRHPEGEHEADALLEWAGDGAAMLYARHDEGQTIALLLERCRPGSELRGEPEARQDEVVADLLARLWREPAEGHPFRPLQEMCHQWADSYEAAPDPRLDPGLARAGVALFRSLPSTADREVLLPTDLHAGNILSAEREPWLAIDPKPYLGDPCYDPLQHLLNCSERLSADPHEMVDRMAQLCGLDRDRVRLWLFARCVVESSSWPVAADVARRLAPV
jgi:streptomycin 6-kinase